MNTKKILSSIINLAFMLLSCNPATQFEGSTDVSLESEKEKFSSGEQVQLTLFNDTNSDLFLQYCGPSLLYRLEAKENERWINYAGGLCLALYAPEFVPVLEPGRTKEITFDSLVVGQYRYNLSYKLSSVASDNQEVSIEFVVK